MNDKLIDDYLLLWTKVKFEQLKLVVKQAENMTSYEHHSGYPRYDGGHSEPEIECNHSSCEAVREIRKILFMSPKDE